MLLLLCCVPAAKRAVLLWPLVAQRVGEAAELRPELPNSTEAGFEVLRSLCSTIWGTGTFFIIRRLASTRDAVIPPDDVALKPSGRSCVDRRLKLLCGPTESLSSAEGIHADRYRRRSFI